MKKMLRTLSVITLSLLLSACSASQQVTTTTIIPAVTTTVFETSLPSPSTTQTPGPTVTTNTTTVSDTGLSSPPDTQTPLGYTTYGTATSDTGTAMEQIMTLASRDDNNRATASLVSAETQSELNDISYDVNIIIMVFSGSGHANHGIHISEIWQFGDTVGIRVEFLPMLPAAGFATPLYSYSYAQVSRSTLKQTGNITFKLFDLVSGIELAHAISNIQSHT